MKWFKHLSGSLNNSIISEAVERFGGDGYLVFFGILEMVSDEFDIYNPGKLTLRMKKITKNLQLSRQKTVKILRFFDEKAKTNTSKDVSFLVDIGKTDVTINCKRLANLCDNHTQKLLKDTSKPLQSKDEVTSSQRSKKKEVRSKKKTIKKGFTPPPETDVVKYFQENGYSIQAAKKAFKYYDSASWKDANGKQVKNWKQKMIGVWFKDENREGGIKKDPINDAIEIYRKYNETSMRKYCKQNDIDPEKVMEVING